MRGRLEGRLTPIERRALLAVATAWVVGGVLECSGWPSAMAKAVDARLDPSLPTPSELAAELERDDPRLALYTAGLALREERRRASSHPRPIDPNTADRAEWDRLPGIGPRIATAIVTDRTRNGGFEKPADLLRVRGIGPKTLQRLVPYLRWSASVSARAEMESSRLPDLNSVNKAFLESLPGIGPKLAKTIVRERRRRGRFHDWPELLAIKGIGQTKLETLRDATRLAGREPRRLPGPGERR